MTDTGTLSFRTGIAVRQGVGYLLACNPLTEENSPHAKILAIQPSGAFESWVKFNAHSICRVTLPRNGIVVLCSDGFYAFFADKVHAGNIFHEMIPSATRDRFGSFRAMASIDGRAYAVGTRGHVFRFDGVSSWRALDTTIPESFDAQAIAGLSDDNLYAAGFHGQLFHYDGQAWTDQSLPTNVNLNALLCTPDGKVYVAGHRGTLLCGENGIWQQIGDETEDIWSLAYFNGIVYMSSFRRVMQILGSQLVAVSFGEVKPKSFYHLSVGSDVLWSIGERDVTSFDGHVWSRVI